jgi:hypothetical protein
MSDRDWATLIVWAVVFGFIPAVIASNKGHNFFVWWLFGALLWIVALPCAIFLKPNESVLADERGEIKCPYCTEYIKPEAKICRYCHSTIVSGTDSL